MVEDYVSREEFNILKREVQDIKKEMAENQKILQEIDKKIDVIAEKIVSGEKIDELKLQPLTARVSKLEENHSWLSKTVLATIIGIIIKLFFDLAKFIN